MAKQKKPPAKSPSLDRNHRSESVISQVAFVSNAEFQESLDAGGVDMEVIRDVALPMVDRGALALQLSPPDPAKIDRLVDIVERSALPLDRKHELTSQLRNDEALSKGVQDAMLQWFNTDSQAFRGHLSDSLDAIAFGLGGGSVDATGKGWALPDGTVVGLSTSSLDGPVTGRAEALLGDLSGHLATGPVAEQVGSDGAAIRGFCRHLYLAVFFDEEEEEEWLVPEMGGDDS
jgi:hypothetical protein